MVKWMRAVSLALFLVILTSCASAGFRDKPDVPEESQLLDMTSGQILYLEMEKDQINSKKLVKSEGLDELSDSFKSFQYEGIDMVFREDQLFFMHVTEKSEKGRFKTRGLGIGSDESEIRSIYGEPLYNPVMKSYTYVILKDGLYYIRSFEELKKQGGPDLQAYMVTFNIDEKNKISSFSITNEILLKPDQF